MSEDKASANDPEQSESQELAAPAPTIPAVTEEATPDYCPNCQAILHGQWCYLCGQNQKPVDRFFLSLVNESFEDVFSWDSRAAKTLFAILFRPGFLTREYFAGRRARYVPPLRLYLITSILFFSILSVSNLIDPPDSIAKISTDGIVVTEATGAASQQEDTGQTADSGDEDLDDLKVEVDRVNFAFLTPDQNQALRDRLKAQSEKAFNLGREDPGELLDAVLDVAPPVLFLLVPVFAILLKIIYLMSGRYYTEHLVLAVHNHCFLFIILMIDFFIIGFENTLPVLEDWGRTIIRIWVPVYMYLSLITAYRQGYFLTFLKYNVLGISYIVLFVMGLAVALLAGVMTL